MFFNLLFEGERKLFGVIGANVALGFAKVAAVTNRFMFNETHLFTNLLTIVQILVAVATLVYMILKVRKLYKKKTE